MGAREKYQSLIDMAHDSGASEVEATEEGGVLRVRAVVPDAAARQKLYDEYERLDPGRRSGDLALKVEVTGGGGDGGGETYTVQSGDTLSAIGQRFGVAWRDIFEANRDQLNDPDRIQPGQNLRIPSKG